MYELIIFSLVWLILKYVRFFPRKSFVLFFLFCLIGYKKAVNEKNIKYFRKKSFIQIPTGNQKKILEVLKGSIKNKNGNFAVFFSVQNSSNESKEHTWIDINLLKSD